MKSGTDYGTGPLDGLPCIERYRRYHNLVIATGHGILGISLAPITGKIFAELASHYFLNFIERLNLVRPSKQPIRFNMANAILLRAKLIVE